MKSASLPTSSEPIVLLQAQSPRALVGRRGAANRAAAAAAASRQYRLDGRSGCRPPARMTENIDSSGPPATSLPRPTTMPASRYCASGIAPLARNMFDDGQWATRAPVSASRATSRSRQMDGVGEDRARTQSAGVVVHVGVVARVRKEARRPLRSRRGPRRGVSASRCRSRAASAADSRSMSADAAHGEPRRDSVTQPAVVAAVPALDQALRLTQRASSTSRSPTSRRSAGDPSSPCREPARMPCSSAAAKQASRLSSKTAP